MTMRETVRGALLGGALGAVGLMLYASRDNTHILLNLLFVGWVLAPFVALSFAEAKSSHWPMRMQTTLHWVALIVVAVTLVLFVRRIYHPPQHQPASVFVLVPPVAIVFMVVIVGLAKVLSPRSESAA